MKPKALSGNSSFLVVHGMKGEQSVYEIPPPPWKNPFPKVRVPAIVVEPTLRRVIATWQFNVEGEKFFEYDPIRWHNWFILPKFNDFHTLPDCFGWAIRCQEYKQTFLAAQRDVIKWWQPDIQQLHSWEI